MAVPKKKTSVSRKRIRSLHSILKMQRSECNYSVCNECNYIKKKHTVCTNCGFYAKKLNAGGDLNSRLSSS